MWVLNLWYASKVSLWIQALYGVVLHTVKRSTAHTHTNMWKQIYTHMPTLPYSLNGTHYCTRKRCPTVTGWLPLALDRVKWQDLVNTIMNLQVTKHAWNFLIIWGSISFSRITVLVQSIKGLNIQADANGAQPNMINATPHLSLTLNSTYCSSSSAHSIQHCQEHNRRNGCTYYNLFHFLLSKWIQ